MKHSLSPVEVLEKMDKILDRPEHWVQGSYAEDEHGTIVEATDASAQTFCLLGAGRRAAGEDYVPYYVQDFLEIALPGYLPEGGRYLATFNDMPTTTFRKVKLVIRKALRFAREAEAEEAGNV